MIYVDDVLTVIYKPNKVMDYLHKIYFLKEPLTEPDFYLGVNIGKHKFDDGTVSWYQYANCYLNIPVRIVDKILVVDGRPLLPKQ